LQILKLIRFCAWSLAVVIVILSLVPAQLRPVTGLPHRLEHFATFGVVGFAFGLSYNTKGGLLLVQLVIFAACVEITQIFVPGRHARLSDFLVDAIAIACGSIAGSLPKQRLPDSKI
jgi:VanZ family protein